MSLNPGTILGPEFYGFLLPWIFTFAIVYGLLMKLNLFGSDVNKKVNIALAFVIAFFVTGTAGPYLAAFFINLFGGAATYLAGILVILLFMAMIGYDTSAFKKHSIYLIAIILIGVLLFLSSTGYLIGSVVLSSDIAVLAFWLAIIIIAIYMITGDSKSSGESSGGKSE